MKSSGNREMFLRTWSLSGLVGTPQAEIVEITVADADLSWVLVGRVFDGGIGVWRLERGFSGESMAEPAAGELAPGS